MPCYYPLNGFRARTVNDSGRRSIVFDKKAGYEDMPVQVPCGQCTGCRLERSRQWAIRCVHEASLYDQNCFITLTYDDEHLPADGSVAVEHWQKFMKRLRKKYARNNPGPIRFFHCGEYGDLYGRPHYHACLFNFDFPDKEIFKVTDQGHRLYISDSLARLWPDGLTSIGDVTFESAAYVARYIMKKITGEQADEHYQGRKPEYTTMSRRPGIGKGWYERWKDEVFPLDEVVIRGKKMKPPKFYTEMLEKEAENEHNLVKVKRKVQAKKHADNQTLDRLRVRETVKNAQIQSLTRKLS